MQLEAVTIDAFGTLVELDDPVPRLQTALLARGVERSRDEIERAFATEVAYYIPRSHEGRDAPSLAQLRRRCTAVFLEAARARIDANAFAPDFVGSLLFRPLPGAARACRVLRAHGLRLAVASNWDISLTGHLEALRLDVLVDTVVTSAEAGAPKPRPNVWRLALERLGVEPALAVHVGDSDADAEGARSLGLRFEPAPLADAVARILT